MNMNSIHNHCTSFAVSAMLTAAVFSAAPDGLIVAGVGPLGASHALESAMAGLRADGWHGAAGMALPVTIATAQTQQVAAQTAPEQPPFSEIQLGKLNRYWDTHDKEITISLQYSRPLGLTKGEEAAVARRISGKDENKVFHLFARLNNGAGYYLTREPGPGEFHLYWVGFDFKVIAALSVSKDTGMTVLAVPDAEKELRTEYAEWAKVADKL